MATLSEIQKSPDVGRPERKIEICVAGKLAAERETIDRELFRVRAELTAAERQEAGAREGGRQQAVGKKPRSLALRQQAEELAEQSDALGQRMAAATITDILIRATTPAEWRAWSEAHPARDPEEDPAGAERDKKYAARACNIDDLIPLVGDYVVRYGNETPTDGAWQFIVDNAALGDLTTAASHVAALHVQGVDLGKSRRTWLSTPPNGAS
ncbi:hypothetical protein QWY28_17375 [Nocardioides sp. SOB77]|uniref:DUF222 domain-containing protein n=1 Tax=Nocardioides oceani TaxID=3058369 RepID=A0ABT8FJ86_9ACTN|nr:hypothetical protein [Nocardioides oceani]MDN4174736.1 hypothetical protein [Nocardioides oceani]